MDVSANRPFSLLIKPTQSDCNLRCRYCFYLGKSQLYPGEPRHRMSDEVLERMIATYMATDQPMYAFGWQGGEPTLMGAGFFRKVTALQKRHGRPGASAANGLQTNATLLTDEMAAHFAEYNFLLGCSLDGPAEIHDHYRRTIGGEPTHALVMKGLETLRRHNVAFNILVLVSQSNVRRAAEVYRYLTDQGFLHHQYIPCVEFDADGRLEPFAITGAEWGGFLCELFDAWYPRDTRRVSIRHTDAIIGKLVDKTEAMCTMGRDCRHYFVVEYNGDMYPCDFFVEPRWKLGNVMETSWQQAQGSALYAQFGTRKTLFHPRCAACRYEGLCAGDCLKHRIFHDQPPQTLSHLCAGWERFYTLCLARMEKLAQDVRDERRQDELLRLRETREQSSLRAAGRNAPCPCGSGEKFKRCCGKAQLP